MLGRVDILGHVIPTLRSGQVCLQTCPHCGEPLAARRHYQWRKTVQQLAGAVYVASEAKECLNPGCDHQGQPYTSLAAQMVIVLTMEIPSTNISSIDPQPRILR